MSDFLQSRHEQTAQAAKKERRQANHTELTSKLADVIGSTFTNHKEDLHFKWEIAQQEMQVKHEQRTSLETALAATSATFGEPEKIGKSGKRVELFEEEEKDKHLFNFQVSFSLPPKITLTLFIYFDCYQ
ncbi:hypothetical protein CROQUDRAFT_86275 [Cronartium quercuum f. sp. fusiforme G11]|uniref:Uncharacterized protein n=1 Tax=Cronartium quercuum f. sp. fusiforme G11 TaxID=708437 RepID=A0A9P6NQS7_9BASI|nr:hypothetical protein CROQUDRAFT_86275 [Cronartium quercuum f. sp. fusiforme G11]